MKHITVIRDTSSYADPRNYAGTRVTLFASLELPNGENQILEEDHFSLPCGEYSYGEECRIIKAAAERMSAKQGGATIEYHLE